MERRVRAERGPSARERCGNDWHSPPVFMGRVNQMPIFRDVPGEASDRYGKLLTRLTGHTKTAKKWAEYGLSAPRETQSATAEDVALGAETWSRPAQFLRLSLQIGRASCRERV